MSENGFVGVEIPENPSLLTLELSNGTVRQYQEPHESFRVEGVSGGLIKVHVYETPAWDNKRYADTIDLSEVVFTRVISRDAPLDEVEEQAESYANS